MKITFYGSCQLEAISNITDTLFHSSQHPTNKLLLYVTNQNFL